ncbi:uncharacterized protein LOC123514139 [Portunus trituberculatus]|uniref:uncharacterized protein LOC123514139 n=1 Tax=Portunus trituberculatus TaxID=210409 RepID=UPI001E1CE76D|nr:uncharacterized protein LOC123514139 [Portunus trituberculatus]
MEKLLRPDRFEGSQDTTPAEWEHWYCTFKNFLDSLSGDPAPDKLKLLVNHVSPSVYNHISDCQSYTDAVEVLKAIYVKPTNVIFARHQLATRKQVSGESIDQFLRSLKLLSKDCRFKAVTSDTYTQESIRDAFITGLQSPMIRQRLLEKDSLTLDESVQLARSLDSAQRNAETYVTPTSLGNLSSASSISAPPKRSDMDPQAERAEETSAAASKSMCYFCGNPRHPRQRCPARNVDCFKCGKKGHFGKACKAPKTTYSRNEVAASTICASGLPDPPHRTTMNVRVNGVSLTALVDSGIMC